VKAVALPAAVLMLAGAVPCRTAAPGPLPAARSAARPSTASKVAGGAGSSPASRSTAIDAARVGVRLSLNSRVSRAKVRQMLRSKRPVADASHRVNPAVLATPSAHPIAKQLATPHVSATIFQFLRLGSGGENEFVCRFGYLG